MRLLTATVPPWLSGFPVDLSRTGLFLQLACMGPEAVADHYEEIVAAAAGLAHDLREGLATSNTGNDSAVADKLIGVASAGRAADECIAAAWLCITVLPPAALLRLEARGAPVRDLMLDSGSPFATCDPTEELLRGDGPFGRVHAFPQVADVLNALEVTVEEQRALCRRSSAQDAGGASSNVPPEVRGDEGANEGGTSHLMNSGADCSGVGCLRGPIIHDGPSKLCAFVPVSLVWSVQTHARFPGMARMRAIELLLIGAKLSGEGGGGGLPLELWLQCVMPMVLVRRSLPGGVGEGGKLLDVLK